MSRRGALAALVIAGVALAMWPAQSASAATDEWSTFHHDALHTGVSSDTAVGAAQATSLSVKWSQPVGGGPVYASPVVANNRVYEVGVGGVVQAFTTTGTSLWTSPPNIGSGAVASPAVDGNSLYVGSDNGVLTALDATTGTVQCTFALGIFAPETTPGRIEASPVVGHDSSGPVVYFGDTGQSEGTNHGREWAVYGFGNTNGNCRQKWMHDLTHPGAKTTGSWSPPALVTDSLSRTLVVYGTGQPDDAVYALDASNGSQVWRFQTLQSFSDADVGAGPTISAPGVNGFSHGVVYIDGKDQIEYAIDLLTGAQLWQFDMKANSGHFSNSVSCAALVGNLVVVAYWKYVYAFNATTGALVWRTAGGAATTLSSVSVSGAAGDQVVLRSDMAGSEFAYRLSDGALLKSLKIAATRFDASTAVADGMAFVAGEDSNLYALSETASGNPGSITGTVTNANTHALIQGATVKCSLCAPTTTTTDVNGKYTFPSAPPGSDSVTFSDTGYVSQTVAVAVTAGTQATQDAALVPDGSITGTVTDANSHALLQGAMVTCSVCAPTTATTATDGTYTLSNAPPGSDSITFSDSGYVSQTVVVSVTSGTPPTQQDAALVPDGSITGTVTDANSHALLQGATATCSVCTPTTATTAGDGTYTLSNAPPGNDSITFSDTGYVSQIAVVSVTSGPPPTPQDAALVPDGSITGTVTDSVTTNPIDGATVTCSACAPTTTTTAGGGKYTLSNAPPGNDSVTFSDTGYVSQTKVVAVTSGPPPTQQDAALTPGHQFIFSDGFESGSLAAWTSSTGLSAEIATVHSGTYAAEGNVTGLAADARETLPSTYTAGYERVWFNKTSSSTQVYLLQASTAANARVASVYVSTGGFLGLQAADNTYHLSTTPVTNTGWHELELRFTVGTTGSADVWLDGVDVIPLSTVNLKTTPVGVMQIGDQTSHTWHVFYDDAAFDTNMIP